MNISLTPDLENYIEEKLRGGMYNSASEVIRESLRFMYTYDGLQKQRITQLNSEIGIGMEQLNQKRYVDGSTSRYSMKHKIDAIAKSKE